MGPYMSDHGVRKTLLVYTFLLEQAKGVRDNRDSIVIRDDIERPFNNLKVQSQ